MSFEYEKIKTLEQFAEDYFLNQAQDKSGTYVFSLDWEATYNIEVTKNNRYHKTMTLHTLDVKNPFIGSTFKTSSKKFNFVSGDIANDFLGIFKNNSRVIADETDIDLDSLNNFLVKYNYPKIQFSKETSESQKTPAIAVSKKGIEDTYSQSGRVRINETYFPRKNDIESYIQALRSLYLEIYRIRHGVGFISFDLNHHHHFNLKEKNNTISSHHNTINSLILLDVSNTLDKYELSKCIRCGKLYFKNKGQKVCPYGCKPPSLMTKAEAENENIKSSNLSNDYKRLAFLKKLNRKGFSFEEKNKRLKEEGFELLKSKKKSRGKSNGR